MARPGLTLLLPMLLLTSLLPSCGCDERAALTDIERAVATAREALIADGRSLAGHRLVGARQPVHEGRYVWRVTCKPTHLLPEDPATGLVGAGGEVFVNVDPATGDTTLTFGE